MRTIPKTFKKYGFLFKMVHRNKNIALYSQENKEGVVRAYEVHKVRVFPAISTKYKQRDGTVHLINTPEQEKLGRASEFGLYGWSYDTLPQAEMKFQELILKQEGEMFI